MSLLHQSSKRQLMVFHVLLPLPQGNIHEKVHMQTWSRAVVDPWWTSSLSKKKIVIFVSHWDVGLFVTTAELTETDWFSICKTANAWGVTNTFHTSSSWKGKVGGVLPKALVWTSNWPFRKWSWEKDLLLLGVFLEHNLLMGPGHQSQSQWQALELPKETLPSVHSSMSERIMWKWALCLLTSPWGVLNPYQLQPQLEAQGSGAIWADGEQ